jgi:hypothetical protein
MRPDRDLGLTIHHSSLWRPLFGVAGQWPPDDSHPLAGLRTTLEEQGAIAAFVTPGRPGSGPVAWAALYVVEDDHPIREGLLRESLVASSTCLAPPSIATLGTQLGSAHRIQAIRLLPLQGLSRPAAMGQVTWTWLQEGTSTRVVLIAEAPFPHPFSEVVRLMDELAEGLSWNLTNDPPSDTTPEEEEP